MKKKTKNKVIVIEQSQFLIKEEKDLILSYKAIYYLNPINYLINIYTEILCILIHEIMSYDFLIYICYQKAAASKHA